MTKIVIILLIVALVYGVAVLSNKMLQVFYNLQVLYSKDLKEDTTKHRHGVVVNKRERRLESDKSIILPF